MLNDIYVLAKSRSSDYIQKFSERWVNELEEAADEYEFPQYSNDPTMVFTNAHALIEKLIHCRQESYSLYWTNPKGVDVSSTMMFFTEDNGLIVGITSKEPNINRLEKYLLDIAKSVEGRYGLILTETAPPESATEFMQMAIKEGYDLNR